MTKIFPSDSEPPEETVELWTGGKAQQQQQQQQQRLAESRQQKLLRLLRCISEHTDPREAATAVSESSPSTKSRLNDLFASLLCLQSGTCTDSPVETSVVHMLQCYEPQCSESCVDADNFAQCVASCIQPSGEKFLHSILKRRASHRSLKRMAPNELYDTLNEMETRGRQDLNLSRGLPKRSEDLDGMIIAKRYRLGLYDCISSYCGQLSGGRPQILHHQLLSQIDNNQNVRHKQWFSRLANRDKICIVLWFCKWASGLFCTGNVWLAHSAGRAISSDWSINSFYCCV